MPNDYGMEKAAYAGEIGMALRNPSPRERLQEKRKVLETELTAVNAAIQALDANPNIEQVMTLVQRAL